jgi:hypothetical protein
MKAVSRFEANLLRILHFFLKRGPAEQALALIVSRFPRPTCLSRTAVELVQDSLARGCVAILAREGGWRRERFLRGEQVVEGRLWERTPPGELGLRFSLHSLRFLMWITALKPSDQKPHWQPPRNELTVGDWLLFFLAYQAVRETEVGEALRARSPFVGHALCRLAWPQDFMAPTADVALDFAVWTTGQGACILEAMQHELANRWVQLERAKARIADWKTMQALGRAQDQVLAAFLQEVDTAGRRDLARFLLHAAAELLPEGATPALWIEGLTSAGPRLADRSETYRAAGAFLRHLDRLAAWEREARAIGYLDEGYAASQLWKADWERCQGAALHLRAQTVLRAMEPFRTQS